MSILDTIFYWAKVDPHRHAFVQPQIVTTYEALADAIESTGDRIEKMGISRQETVGVSILNPSFCVVTVFALLRRGYSAALVNPAVFPLLRMAGVQNLIYDTQGLMLSGGRNIRFDSSWVPDAKPPGAGNTKSYRKPVNAPGHVIMFTSGTTGLPKRVAQPMASLDTLAGYPITCASGPHRKILIMAGLRTTLGFNRVCEVLSAGKTACFAPDTESALTLVDLFGVEVAVMSAAQAMSFVKVKWSYPGYRVDSLKAIFVGGGKIEPEGIRAIRAAICKNVINQYGSTEAGVAALTPFDKLEDRPGAIAMPWTELQIVDDAGQPLPADTEGVIRYRTPQLAENLKCAGTEEFPGVRDGWFYPGDIGLLTAAGTLRFSGRISDVINRGGVKVSASRIEAVLGALPQIKEAAACGIVGSSGLEELWIAVVGNGPVDTGEIEKVLRDHNDVGMEPDEVIVMDDLPRGELGKVQKARLKELLRSRKGTS